MSSIVLGRPISRGSPASYDAGSALVVGSNVGSLITRNSSLGRGKSDIILRTRQRMNSPIDVSAREAGGKGPLA